MSRRREKLTVVAVTAALVLAGLGVMLYPKATDLRYQFAQWRLATQAVASQPAPTGGIILPESAVAHIEIPSIDIDAYVLEGTDPSTLNQGPGHYPGTPLPGESGNVAIAGHRTMYGHVFHDLHRLGIGDEIRTGTESTVSTYVVTEILVVDDSATEVVDATDDSRLILTTCHPIGSARQRLVVVAELAS